jgi:hypothetical protein
MELRGLLPSGNRHRLPVCRLHLAGGCDATAAHPRRHPRLRQRGQQCRAGGRLGGERGAGPDLCRAPGPPVPRRPLGPGQGPAPGAALAARRQRQRRHGAERRGQVVGISGYYDQAVGRFSAIHAVRWQRGRAIPVGTLGGVAWNTPMSINDRGEVVGFSNVSAADGGAFNPTPSRGPGARASATWARWRATPPARPWGSTSGVRWSARPAPRTGAVGPSTGATGS